MKYNFDEIVERRGTYSLKWDGADMIKEFGITERFDEDTIPLFTADMDLPVAQPLVEALHRVVDHRIYGYSIFPEEYYAAIEHWFKKRYDWHVAKEQVVYSPGTVHALDIAVKAFSGEGDGVLIQRPVYPPFTSTIEGNGRVVVNSPLKLDKEGYYSIDFEDFEEKAKDPKTKLFVLCHPHNPTGRVFTTDELTRMSEICRSHHVVIVADEIHGDLIRVGQAFQPMAKVVEKDDHIVTLTAINKTFNVAGLHCTNAIISDPDLRAKFSVEMGIQLASPFAIAALIAVYTEGEEWLEQLKAYIDDTLHYVQDFLADRMPEVKVRIPEGTYVLWMDFSGYGLTSEEVHDRIYNRANVVLEDGSMFGSEGTQFQRMCVPSPRPVIEEALERIAKEFQDIPKE